VIDLLFVRIRFRIALADTLGDDAGVALGVAGILAVFALHTRRILEEVSAKRTAHDVVELVLYKLVAVHLVDLLLALSNSALSSQTEIHLPLSVFFDEAELELDLSSRLKVEPSINRASNYLWLGARIAKGRTSLALAAARSLGWCSKRARRWAHWELTRSRATHPVGRHPAGAVHLGLDPLATHLLNDVRYPDPKQADGHGVLGRLVIDGKLDFVGLVNFYVVILGFPAVISRRPCSGHDSVFDLNGNESFWASSKSPSSGVIHVLDGHDTNGKLTAQGLAKVRSVDGVVW
jgi:hypothetical protein